MSGFSRGVRDWAVAAAIRTDDDALVDCFAHGLEHDCRVALLLQQQHGVCDVVAHLVHRRDADLQHGKCAATEA